VIQRKPCAALAAALLSAVAFASHAFADTMTMWVRASGTNAAAHLVDLWNETHKDKIELTTIPDNQMVTKLATGVQAGEVPDLVSFDLIYMPDFMKAGFLVDLTDDLKADPNYASVARAYKDIATYEGNCTERASRPTSRSSSGTRTCSRERGSIRKSRRRRSAKSMRTPRKFGPSARMSTASTSRAPARAAIFSRPRR